MTFLTILGVIEILCSFRLVLEGKTGNEIPEPLRLGFLEKFPVHNLVLSDPEDNTSRSLNIKRYSYLPLSRTLLVFRQKS